VNGLDNRATWTNSLERGKIMKYFTYELWNQINSECDHESQNADEQWLENCKAYQAKYRQLENRLSKKVFNHFLKKGFHDFRLEKFQVIHGPYGILNPVQVTIQVTNTQDSWVITYKKIKKLEVQYDITTASFSYPERRGFDDWGYSELLPVDDNTLSHEILFASGATILIHFPNKNIFVERIT
jgi:hypothetical protein